jgi:hypothetical protein
MSIVLTVILSLVYNTSALEVDASGSIEIYKTSPSVPEVLVFHAVAGSILSRELVMFGCA